VGDAKRNCDNLIQLSKSVFLGFVPWDERATDLRLSRRAFVAKHYILCRKYGAKRLSGDNSSAFKP